MSDQQQVHLSSAWEAQAAQEQQEQMQGVRVSAQSVLAGPFLSLHTVLPRGTPTQTTPKCCIHGPAKEKAENFMVATTSQGHSAIKWVLC